MRSQKCWYQKSTLIGNPIYHDYDYDDDGSDESLSVYDAAIIWASRGKDEDYMFGYSEDELESAL